MLSDSIKKLAGLAWLLPGFLLWAAFPPMAEKTDVLFALAPLLWLTRQGEIRRSGRQWFLNGCFFWVATLSWMPAIVKNGGPWPLVVLGWGALAAYCAAYFAAFGYLSAAYWRWSRERSYGFRLLGVLIVEPVLWCGLELVRSRFLGGFAWHQLGVVPVNGGLGAPAAWGGVYLLSAVVILINGTLAGIADRVIASMRRRRVSPLRTVETVLAFALIFGVYSLPSPAPAATGRWLKVAMLQRNFPCVFKAQEENPYETVSRLLKNVVALKPELVVLPESALCDLGTIGSSGAQGFADWIARETGGAALLAGGSRWDAAGRGYNSAALYDGRSLQVYDKVHLVPFGEFIPGDKLIPALQKLAPVGSCTPGKPRLLTLGTGAAGAEAPLPLGVAICFEDTDSALMRQLAAMGAQALVFITNDSWFSNSQEAEQHAWQAVARATETGLPVVRVGNSGVTGTISPAGATSWLTGADGRVLVDRPGTMFDRLAVGPRELTAYVRYGDWPLGGAFALLILSMVLVKYRHDYEKRRTLSL